MNNKKYSDWLRIDLHIHTDLSKKTKTNDYKGIFSVNTLKERLKANEVQIFSLTDHNIVNIQAYEEYYDHYTDNDPLLLLGVELDILGTSKTYHSLLIFNYTTKEKAKDIGQKLENKFTAKKILDDTQRVLTIEEIIELFPEDDFFFIPHAGNTKSIVDGNKPNIQDAQKMVLLMQSAFEKVPEKARQKYNNGFDHVLDQAFQNKNDIAYIEFSDNHNIECYPCTHKGEDGTQHSFYYIKGNKGYETLRLAFIDPKSRIKSQEEYNQLDKHLNIIKNLKIKNNDFLNENELTFSPHLNVIVGGRSSGKSLLIYILGKKIDKVKIIDSKYKELDETKIQVQSNRDIDYKDKTSIESDIIYLNQGDIVRYFEEKKLYDLADKSNKKDEYDSAKEGFIEHKNALDKTVNNLIESYKTVHDAGIVKYEFHKSTIDSILSEKHIIKLRLEELQNKFDISTKIEDSINLIDQLQEHLSNFKSNLLFDISDNEQLIINDFENLVEIKKRLINKKQLSTRRKIKFINGIHDLVKKTNNTLDSESIQKTLSNESLRTLKQNIKEHFLRASYLKTTTDKLENFDYTKREVVLISDNVRLVLEVEEEANLKTELLGAFNRIENQDNLYMSLLKLLNNKIAIKHLGGNTPNNLSKKFDTQLGMIKDKLSNPKDYLQYTEENTSKNKSPGYNSEKYLEIILRNPNTKIVFIDQPEDNLGNKFISDELVTIIREIKFQKQIFLVTHNPSIVVYGDAENIILATNNNNKISYKQIVLEDKEAQKEICGILDGGEYIFNNRSRKYNIQRILREDNQHG
jgi:hypothetical protein